MFEVNDIVLYDRTCVCRVEGLREMPFPGEGKINYYMLRPVYDDAATASTIYVPVTAGADRVSRTLTGEELKALLATEEYRVRWIEAPMIRKKEFSDVLSRGNPEELIGMIRVIGEKRAEKLAAGQKLSESDEKYLLTAQRRMEPLFRHAAGEEWSAFLRLTGAAAN